jgi:ferric-dicitrate binding protein FerR (iron transport regulator)
MEKAFQVADLLYKKIKGSLSPEEEKQLQQWVDQDPANATLYKKMLDDHTLIDKLDDYGRFDTTRAWNSVSTTLFKTKVIALNARKLLRYAAVFVPFAILISVGYYWWDQQYNALAKVDETFTPWEPKATLILANGKKLNLQREKTTTFKDGGAHLKNQDETLTYSSAKEMKEAEQLVYHTLLTPKGGNYRLTLSDGTEVWLNANTSITYPVRFTDSTREVFLTGEAFFDVQHNGKPFIVSTQETNIRVLGTSFNVFAYENEPYTSTTLVDGSVKLSTATMERTLVPNEQANVLLNQTDIQVKTVNTELFTSWIKGKIEFEEESLEAVMRRLARLYDFEYEFEDSALKEFHFTARIDNNQPISNILKMLEMTTNVHFKLKNNTLIIH